MAKINNENIPVSEKITAIAENWFLEEPLIFSIYCTHKLTVNEKIKVPIRCGKMKIEYNPNLMSKMTQTEIEELLKIEVIRILLKHPYQRMPACPNLVVLALASNITIKENYSTKVPLPTAKDYNLPKELSYEEYYARLMEKLRSELSNFAQRLMSENGLTDDSDDNDSDDDNSDNEDSNDNQSSNGSGSSSNSESQISDKTYESMYKDYETAELWEENQEAAEIVNAEIEKAQLSNKWGSIPGDLQQLIEATLVIEMDYRRMLSMFRASILSSERKLTRMRPNRRYGFSYMGSQHDFTTGLLIAVDVSGSVSDESLQKFFSIINRFFKYGIKTIDVIQFDAERKEEVLSLKKAKKQVKVLGRGGTDFQPAIDFYEQNPKYDGLIMFTDGEAGIPKLHKFAENILWVLTSKAEYDAFKSNMLDHLPGSRATYIP